MDRPVSEASLYTCLGREDWLSFLEKRIEAVLLCSKNLALDHLGAFSVLEDRRESNSRRFWSMIFLVDSKHNVLVFLYKRSNSVVRSRIFCLCILLWDEAILISLPLTTALWAVHTIEGGVSGRALNEKYSSIDLAVSDSVTRSESKASFSLQVCGVGASPIKFVVKEVTW